MSKSRAKGTDAETAVVGYLRRFWPWAERRALRGTLDAGDIAGTPGVCWEVKAVVKGGYDFPGWLAELETERQNAHCKWGVLVVKPKGVAQPERYWAVMPFPQACELLGDADDAVALPLAEPVDTVATNGRL